MLKIIFIAGIKKRKVCFNHAVMRVINGHQVDIEISEDATQDKGCEDCANSIKKNLNEYKA